MMADLSHLVHACRDEAGRAPFPVDREVYAAAGRDPLTPILLGGRLDTPLCFFARDLGRDEVLAGEPLKGAGGRLVRTGIHRHCGGSTGTPTERDLQRAAERVLLANTVPYKPPGNKAYSEGVKDRFRPFLLELLCEHFHGRHIITLGTEAFLWFAPCGEGDAVERFWKRPDRYQATLEVTLRSGEQRKPVVLAPLPHPSPLNQTYYRRFPEMLAARLSQLAPGLDGLCASADQADQAAAPA